MLFFVVRRFLVVLSSRVISSIGKEKRIVLFLVYSRLSLSRTPRDSIKHFEISVLRHIRFAEMRKTINRTTTFNRMNM